MTDIEILCEIAGGCRPHRVYAGYKEPDSKCEECNCFLADLYCNVCLRHMDSRYCRCHHLDFDDTDFDVTLWREGIHA